MLASERADPFWRFEKALTFRWRLFRFGFFPETSEFGAKLEIRDIENPQRCCLERRFPFPGPTPRSRRSAFGKQALCRLCRQATRLQFRKVKSASIVPEPRRFDPACNIPSAAEAPEVDGVKVFELDRAR